MSLPTPRPPVRGGQVRFAVATPFSPHQAYRVYLELADILERALGRPVQLTFRRSFAEVNDLLRSHQADVVQLCSEGYQRGRAGFGLQAIAVPRVRGSLHVPSYVIMRANRAPGRPDTLAVAEPNCAPYPAGEAGPARKVAIKSHDRAVKAVREGLVDAALVDGFAFERLAAADPSLRDDLRVVSRTPAYLTPPVAVHPDLDPAIRQALTRALLGLHEGAPGRAVLAELGVERFEAPPVADTAPTRRAVRN